MAGADEERPDVDSHEQVYGLARLLALSDGVFAFAMTLLVVQLLVPQLGPGQVGQLGTKLLDQMPSYVSYLISFAVISIYWFSHHRLFRYVRRWDVWLIALNLGALLFIAVMPFPTAIMGRYGDQTVAVVIYAANLGSAGLYIWLMWWYGIRRHLLAPSLEQHAARQFRWRAFLTPAVFFLSIPVAFWQPRAAQASWGLIWLGIYVLSRPHRRVSNTRRNPLSPKPRKGHDEPGRAH